MKGFAIAECYRTVSAVFHVGGGRPPLFLVALYLQHAFCLAIVRQAVSRHREEADASGRR